MYILYCVNDPQVVCMSEVKQSVWKDKGTKGRGEGELGNLSLNGRKKGGRRRGEGLLNPVDLLFALRGRSGRIWGWVWWGLGLEQGEEGLRRGAKTVRFLGWEYSVDMLEFRKFWSWVGNEWVWFIVGELVWSGWCWDRRERVGWRESIGMGCVGGRRRDVAALRNLVGFPRMSIRARRKPDYWVLTSWCTTQIYTHFVELWKLMQLQPHSIKISSWDQNQLHSLLNS